MVYTMVYTMIYIIVYTIKRRVVYTSIYTMIHSKVYTIIYTMVYTIIYHGHGLWDSKSHFMLLKKVYSGCKRIQFKKIKTSPGPVTVMAARSPGGGRHLKGQGKDGPYTRP
jgi:hypothetical protein